MSSVPWQSQSLVCLEHLVNTSQKPLHHMKLLQSIDSLRLERLVEAALPTYTKEEVFDNGTPEIYSYRQIFYAKDDDDRSDMIVAQDGEQLRAGASFTLPLRAFIRQFRQVRPGSKPDSNGFLPYYKTDLVQAVIVTEDCKIDGELAQDGDAVVLTADESYLFYTREEFVEKFKPGK